MGQTWHEHALKVLLLIHALKDSYHHSWHEPLSKILATALKDSCQELELPHEPPAEEPPPPRSPPRAVTSATGAPAGAAAAAAAALLLQLHMLHPLLQPADPSAH